MTGNIQSPVGIFPPKQISGVIRLPNEAGFKNFHVHSGAVKACVHTKPDIPEEVPVVHSGVNSLGIVTLIQNQPLEY